MELERLFLTCLLFLFAWIPTGGESAPVGEQEQFDTTDFTNVYGNSPSEEERTRAEDELANLITDILNRGYWKTDDVYNDVYDDVSSDEIYEAEALGKRGRGNARSGGKSNRRRPSSETMHATVGFGKRREYKKKNQQSRPKPLLTWRH